MALPLLARHGRDWVFGILACVAGCSFSPGTVTGGSTGEDESGTTDPTTTTITTSTTSPGTSEPTSSSGGPSTSSSSTGEATEDASGSTSIVETTSACEDGLESQVLWAFALERSAREDVIERVAQNLYPANTVPYYVSVDAGVGSVEFTFDAPCATDLSLWILAYDDPGEADNADSLYYAFDEAASMQSDHTDYGCGSAVGDRWLWRPLERFDGPGKAGVCDVSTVVTPLDAGEHTFALLNREAGLIGPQIYNFAGIAAIAISEDPNWHPTQIYDPLDMNAVPDPLPN